MVELPLLSVVSKLQGLAFGAPQLMQIGTSSGMLAPDEFPIELVRWKHTPKLGNDIQNMVAKGGLLINPNKHTVFTKKIK